MISRSSLVVLATLSPIVLGARAPRPNQEASRQASMPRA